jgi:protein-tyrosine phosphatase
VEYASIDVADRPTSAGEMRERMGACLDFIACGLAAGGSVLVHCVAGHSRSVTVVAAFLMRDHGLSLRDALAVVCSARPTACPNSGFLHMLQRYEQELSEAWTTSRCRAQTSLQELTLPPLHRLLPFK